MKSIACCAVILGSLVSLLGAAGLTDNSSDGPSLEYDQSVEKGPNHALRTFVQSITNELGNITLKTNRYTELQPGMHYWEDNQWKESQEIIEIFKDGAVARKGQHKVIFSPNINTVGALDMEMSDGKRLRSHVIGLAYYDAATGKSAIIAEMKDSIGQLVAANQIVYADAFNDIKADIRYEWTKGGLEQDVILLEFPPLPEEFGLASATTRLEVWTEYLDPPQPSKRIYTLKQELDGIKRQQMVEPDSIDEMLDFGTMSTAPGRSFLLNGERPKIQGSPEPSERVLTRWTKIEGRDFLIEAIEYPTLQERFRALLNQGAKLDKPKPLSRSRSSVASASRKIPRKSLGKRDKAIVVAKVPYAAHGFVIDWVYVNTVSNFTFGKGYTYYVQNTCTLSGTTTFEESVVLKYNAPSSLLINGPIVCKTSMHHPAILTARDDNSVGETLAASTGSPNGYYGWPPLSFYMTTNFTLSDIRVRYAGTGMDFQTTVTATIKNIQINGGDWGIVPRASTVFVQNALILDSKQAAFGAASIGAIQVENGTFARVSSLASGVFPSLTNCLINVTNTVPYTGSYNQTVALGDFASAGGGAFYLPAGSAFRDAGTTNITASSLADLKRRTTIAPVVVTGDLGSTARFRPIVPLDANLPDLGYHYDPADYLVLGAYTFGAITIDPGTIVAFYNNGFVLYDGASFSAAGSPINQILFADHKNVQETALTTNPLDYCLDTSSLTTASNIKVDLRFCKVETPEVMKEPKGHVNFCNTSFLGQEFAVQRNSGTLELNLTNCLFYYLAVYGNLNYTTNDVNFYNCTFTGTHGNANLGGMVMAVTANTTWTVRDCIFDTACASLSSSIHDHNGYLSGYTRLQPPASNDVVVASLSYDSGPLGAYYLPSGSSFINAGSRTADAASLYHFTTSTNQTKETNSTVDLGFHYVALNGSNLPVDTDSDGLPDYLEDANGNNAVDVGETDWNNASDAGIKVMITRPKGRPVLP